MMHCESVRTVKYQHASARGYLRRPGILVLRLSVTTFREGFVIVSGVVCHPRNTTVLQEASPSSVRDANCKNRAVGEASRFMHELIN